MNILSKPLFWAVIIFLCAAVFRLTALDLIEFKLDEARDVYEMERFWQNPTLLERGTIQSTGVYNPPLWYYFLAVISAPSRDPQYLSFMIALINCVAVAGFYLVVRRFFGSRTVIPANAGIQLSNSRSEVDPRLHPKGTSHFVMARGDDKKEWFGIAEGAALLLAFSPWSILFSRKIWAPDMILPLVVLWLYFLLKLIIEKESKAILGVLGILGLLVQLHASGIFLAVASITIIIIIKIIKVIELKINFKYALLGILASLIPLLPYINYQIRTGCEDCRNYQAYQEGEAVVVPFYDGNAFLRPFQFVNGSGWDNVLGEEGFRDFKEKYPIVSLFNFIFLLEFLLFVLGVIFLMKHKKPTIVVKMCLLGIVFIIPILYFITKTPSHLYYFLIISPISILIYTLGAFAFPRPKALSIIIITFIIIINIIFELLFVNFLSETKVIPGDYGPTFGVVKEMAGEAGIKVEEYVIGLYNSSF